MRLSSYSGKKPIQTFIDAFGYMNITAKNNLGGWYGVAGNGFMDLKPGNIDVRLVVHELGHSFERHIWSGNGRKYAGTNNPVQMLIDDGVWSGNKLITGKGNRNNDLSAPENGYFSDDTPDQYHPRAMEGGDNAIEDWADMFMNWTFNSFYPNIAGYALYNWVTVNMTGWVN